MRKIKAVVVVTQINVVTVATIKTTLLSRRVAGCRGRTLRSNKDPKLVDVEGYLFRINEKRIR